MVYYTLLLEVDRPAHPHFINFSAAVSFYFWDWGEILEKSVWSPN